MAACDGNSELRGAVFGLVLTGLLPAAAAGQDGVSPTVPDLGRFAMHETCSRIAAARVMAPEEAQLCAENYLELKLSMLPGMDRRRFERLPLAERHRVNLDGYAAFLAWKQRSARAAPPPPLP